MGQGNNIEPYMLAQRQSLSLRAKVAMSERRIREWHDHYQGDVYVAFSGGKDSTASNKDTQKENSDGEG